MKIAFIVCLLSVCNLLTAQAPQAFNYQGLARTTTGDPITNRNISLRIAILAGSPVGSPVYVETHAATTNQFGLFTVEVGRGNATTGQFDAITWGSALHFMEVALDENGGQQFVIIGTSPFLSVPYALYAASAGAADSYWNQNASGINYTAGNVGIGTQTPNHALDILNTAATGGERLQLNLENASNSDRSLAGMLITAGSNSGQTSVQHLSTTYNFEGDKLTDYGQLSTSGRGLALRVDHPDGVVKFLSGLEAGQTPPERMRITADGLVGIGTETPGHPLDILNTAASGDERLQINLRNTSNSDRSYAGMSISSGSNSGLTSLQHIATTYNYEGDKLTNHGQLSTTGKGLVLRVDNPDAVIKFLVGNTPGFSAPERMRIDADGNVGIGTEDPAAKVQVTGGDVFIENIDSGLIMKSPNGNCWRVTMNNDGTLKSTAIACPN